MKKRYILLILLVISLISWLFLFLVMKKESDQPEDYMNITPENITRPEIPTYINSSDAKIIFNVDKGQFQFPNSLSLLARTQSPAISESEILNIAQNYGFGSNYKLFTDIELGETYIWSEDNESLIIYEIGPVLYSKYASKPLNKQLNDKQKTAIATSFIEIGEYVDIKDLRVVNVVNEISDSFSRVNYTPEISDIPVVVDIPYSTVTYIDVGSDGEVLNSHIFNTNNIGSTPEEFELKDYDEVIESLNEASIVALGDQTVEFIPSQDADTVESVKINSINLAYLAPKSDEVLFLPIYILTGEAKIKGEMKYKPAWLYLPALKKD